MVIVAGVLAVSPTVTTTAAPPVVQPELAR